MVFTKQDIANWLDDYFKGVNRNQGTMNDVARSRDYFSDDFRFQMYTSARRPPEPGLSREQLLMLFVHPGLHERLTPSYYVIDADALRAVVQFELRFRDLETGTEWPPLQASAHYDFVAGGTGALQIKRIQYWTQRFTEEFDSLFRLWDQKRDATLNALGGEFFRTGALRSE